MQFKWKWSLDYHVPPPQTQNRSKINRIARKVTDRTATPVLPDAKLFLPVYKFLLYIEGCVWYVGSNSISGSTGRVNKKLRFDRVSGLSLKSCQAWLFQELPARPANKRVMRWTLIICHRSAVCGSGGGGGPLTWPPPGPGRGRSAGRIRCGYPGAPTSCKLHSSNETYRSLTQVFECDWTAEEDEV